jgi:hypothetical protein
MFAGWDPNQALEALEADDEPSGQSPSLCIILQDSLGALILIRQDKYMMHESQSLPTSGGTTRCRCPRTPRSSDKVLAAPDTFYQQLCPLVPEHQMLSCQSLP